MGAEDRLLTLDYCLDGHELYISVDERLLITEMHFRTPVGLTGEDLMLFIAKTFTHHMDSAVAAMTRHVEAGPDS